MPTAIALSAPTFSVKFDSPERSRPCYLGDSFVEQRQLWHALAASVRSQFPALSNTFFATSDRLINFRTSESTRFVNFDAFAKTVQARSFALSEYAVAWKRYVFDVSAPVDVDAISETIEYTFEVLAQFGPDGIDLNNLDPQRIQGEHLAAVLRATSTWRDQTPGWHDALVTARTALEREGVNPQEVLFGLT